MAHLTPTPELAEMCKVLDLDDDTLKKMMDVYETELGLGLNADTVDQASLKCYVTYVQELPRGDEKGQFLALDLGGTNFRVLVIKLARTYFDMRAKVFAVPRSIMTGSGSEFVVSAGKSQRHLVEMLELQLSTLEAIAICRAS